MTTHHMPWHVDDDALSNYAAGITAPVPSASVESHLMSCGRCRERLASAVEQAEVEAGWRRLANAVDQPSSSPLERLGLGHRLSRSTAATPAMVAAGLVAVALVALVPILAAAVAEDAAVVALLLVAPLAPVAAVGLAYREWADPAGEISYATPSAGLHLVAMRSLVVSVAALLAASLALVVVGVWVDLTVVLVFSWCLPGLALSALVLLAGTTRLDPLQVAGFLSLGWAVTVLTPSFTGRRLRAQYLLDVVGSPTLQAVALAIALTAFSLTLTRQQDRRVPRVCPRNARGR